MKNSLGTIKIVMIVAIFMLNIIAIFPTVSSGETGNYSEVVNSILAKENQDEKAISYNQYIDVIFDVEQLNKPLVIDQSVNIPVTVKYWHDVPEQLYKAFGLFPLIRNQFFFGAAMAPQVQIKLDFIDKPDWANLNFQSPSVIVDIPNPGETITVTTTMILSPYREAPAKPKSIDIEASVESQGRLKSFNRPFTISFTPSYIPMIFVRINEPVREVSPRETVTFEVEIINNANKYTLVEVDFDASREWAPVLSPREVEIPPGRRETVIFSVKAPYGLGWHDKTTSMTLTCQPYPSPLPTNFSQYEIGEVKADIQITNYGFSISGIEPFLVFIIIIFVIILVVWFRLKKEEK